MSNRTGGIGFLGLLTILFIGLRLTHHIEWWWGWVLAPLWIPAGIVLSLTAFAGLMAVGVGLAERRARRQREVRK
jgi:hypothetical protein